MREAKRQHLGLAEQLCCLYAAVPGDYETLRVDKDGIVEAERP